MSVQCQSCGTKLAPNAKVCQQCGVVVLPVRETEPIAMPPNPRAKEKKRALVIVFSLVFTASLLLAVIAVLNTNKSQPASEDLLSFASPSPIATAIQTPTVIEATPTQDPALLTTPSPTPEPTATPTSGPKQTRLSTKLPTPSPSASPTPTPLPTPVLKPVQPPVVSPSQVKPIISRQSPQIPPPPSCSELIGEGMKLANKRSFAEALDKYQKARRCAPQNPDLCYLMGVALEGLGRLDEALASHRQCTGGTYKQVADSNVDRLEKKLKKKTPK